MLVRIAPAHHGPAVDEGLPAAAPCAVVAADEELGEELARHGLDRRGTEAHIGHLGRHERRVVEFVRADERQRAVEAEELALEDAEEVIENFRFGLKLLFSCCFLK